mmetsp:Transcript_39868/g.83796  ORF Transcript_39868/g.83796 Transcript_39868/m.83796 type:complete len:223 (+) Transcript_39868:168-836(+)
MPTKPRWIPSVTRATLGTAPLAFFLVLSCDPTERLLLHPFSSPYAPPAVNGPSFSRSSSCHFCLDLFSRVLTKILCHIISRVISSYDRFGTYIPTNSIAFQISTDDYSTILANCFSFSTRICSNSNSQRIRTDFLPMTNVFTFFHLVSSQPVSWSYYVCLLPTFVTCSNIVISITFYAFCMKSSLLCTSLQATNWPHMPASSFSAALTIYYFLLDTRSSHAV